MRGDARVFGKAAIAEDGVGKDVVERVGSVFGGEQLGKTSLHFIVEGGDLVDNREVMVSQYGCSFARACTALVTFGFCVAKERRIWCSCLIRDSESG